MCGPNSSQTAIANGEQGFSTVLQGDFNNMEGQQQSTIKNLNATLNPIVAAGASQQGFSPTELAAKNTEALDTTGANYANAARGLNSKIAGAGGGGGSSSGLETGGQEQLQASLASSAAGTLSNEEAGITQQNYATGRQNFESAVSGEEALGGLENPNGVGGLANQASGQAFQDQSTIVQEQAQKDAEIGGLVEGGVTALAGGLGNLDMTGSSSGKEQGLNFLSGL